jgi:hypothetical protein
MWWRCVEVRKLSVLIVAIAVLSATAAQAASNPAITFNVSAFKVLFGHKLTLSGRAASGSAGQPVSIFSRRYGNTGMTKIATTKTHAGGAWSYKISPSISTTYQARLGSTISRNLTIGVKPAVTVSQLGDGTIWTHIAAGQSFLGQSVELQKQVGASWATVAKATLNATSSVTFPAPVAAGTETVRVAFSVNQAGKGFLGANSNPLLFHAQLVTLVPAAAKVLYGNRVALSGRITSHQAGQIVTMLAWKYGHSAPEKATIVLTRTGGYWNTSDKPTIRTTYQARWSGNQSIKSVVAVEPAVTVSQLINGKISTRVLAGEPLTGRIVELQQLNLGLGWKTLDQLPLNKIGEVTFPAPVITTGAATLRIAMSVNQAGAGYLGTTSHELAYQTKFVSLAIPATKVLFGNSLRLSGQVSSLKKGEKITILAWKYGQSAPTPIKTISTVAGGHWSFRVSPTIQTSYVARWVSSDSVKVLVGVEPLATLTMLPNGRISTHIAAGHSFVGKNVQLQWLRLGVGWQTIEQLPLNQNSSAVFPALSGRNGSALRIALSVNQAGVGFLGSISHAFTYHGA